MTSWRDSDEFDEHETGQLRLGAAGDQRELLPLPDPACMQCGKPMNPAAAILGPVCGDCCRLNHWNATR